MNEPDPIGQLLKNYLAEGEQKTRILEFHDENLPAFKIFPAAQKFHHCYPGGYYDHVLEVMNNTLTIFPLVVLDVGKFDLEDVLVAAYFHDIDKACSLDPGKSFRYELDNEAPTYKQVDYAKELGISISDCESKTSISYKIDKVKAGEPIDEYAVPYFRYRKERSPMDDGAIVASICAHNGILLNNKVLSAICTHHGSFSPLVAMLKVQITPLGILLHTADYISSHAQNGRSMGR